MDIPAVKWELVIPCRPESAPWKLDTSETEDIDGLFFNLFLLH